ncbi:uncharacterized protein LOC114960561 [Acropora millepora]|uniref:uncharacterized protein LOC114960561 n=1 Tax=Acropora millepora TaxID=45264 RepID=UPI001CF4F645|nr:uncharacterized protein LOC114960561 [Acropora millepora]
METYSKRNVMGLSIAQIVFSAAFFLLGMVDGFHIQFAHVSLTFLPCWIAALVLPVGIMGLALSSHQTLRLLQLLKHAIWSFCVACIICSALLLYIYTAWGLSYISLIAHSRNAPGDDYFVAKEKKIVYTEKEKAALVVFAFVIICSVIEIVLSAAMIKICETIAKTPQVSSNCAAYYQKIGGKSQSERGNIGFNVSVFFTDGRVSSTPAGISCYATAEPFYSEMETSTKPMVMALSIAQIVMAGAFFLLGLVDGFYIQFAHVSLTFLPCWIVALVLPVGVMGYILSSDETPRSFLLLKNAIWSLCVVCIICSALLLYIYTTWGLLNIPYIVHVRNTDWLTGEDDVYFVEKGDKIAYTEKEKAALAVFAFVVICNVIEIILAAAMMKISETTTKSPQLSSSCHAYYQMSESQQYLMENPVGQQQVHVV